jgi:hypothetical protein
LDEVDCAVEQVGFEFCFQVGAGVGSGHVSAGSWGVGCYWGELLFEAGDVLGDVNEGGDMNRKLSQDRSQKIDIKNIRLRSLPRKFLNRLQTLASNHQRQNKKGDEVGTLAREMPKKHTDINIPLIVACPSPNLIPFKYNTLNEYAEIRQFNARILYI